MLQLQITEDIYGYRNSLDNLSFPYEYNPKWRPFFKKSTLYHYANKWKYRCPHLLTDL